MSKPRAQIRSLMRELTPLVEPLSLDEAYLDLSGTEPHARHGPGQDHGEAGARASSSEIGITVSIGLSGNKFLAKLASRTGQAARLRRDRHGRSQELPARQAGRASFAAPARCWRRSWNATALPPSAQLQDADPRDLANRYGATGLWLARMAHAEDTRAVDPGGEMKTISSETTFDKRSVAAGRSGSDSVASGRAGFGARQELRPGGPHHGAEAQDRAISGFAPAALRWMRPPSWPTASSAWRRRR